MELTKEQVEQLQKDHDALKAENEKLKTDGGNVDAAKARKKIEAIEKELKEKTDKLDAYEKEKAEKEKASLSEVERLKVEKTEADAKAQAAEGALAKAMKENAFGYAAMQAGCSNVPDAIKLADLTNFKADDPEATKTFVEEFKKSKAYLFGEKPPAKVGTDGKEPPAGSEGKTKEQLEKQTKYEEAKKAGDVQGMLKNKPD